MNECGGYIVDLKNKQVTHKVFGKGSIVNLTDTSVEVKFKAGNKRFIFPDAFGTHLSIVDKEAVKYLKALKEKRKKEQEQEEIEQKEIAKMRLKDRKRALQRERILSRLKIHPRSQAVFWCDKEEEERVFNEWTAFTGTSKSGKNIGKARKFSRLHPNSACLLTARESDKKEEQRRILGLYMVKEDFIGKLNEDGYIPAHQDYRIRLTEKESEKMLFWNYYVNEKYPHRMTWNAGSCRYLDNMTIAQILKDLVKLKRSKKDKEFVQDFLNYFCELNKIDINDIPEPNGALKRS